MSTPIFDAVASYLYRDDVLTAVERLLAPTGDAPDVPVYVKVLGREVIRYSALGAYVPKWSVTPERASDLYTLIYRELSAGRITPQHAWSAYTTVRAALGESSPDYPWSAGLSFADAGSVTL